MGEVRSKVGRFFEKRTVKTLFSSNFAYCLITVVLHYFSFMHPHSESDAIKHFQDLTVALWSNVIFAGVFGLLAAVVSVFRPEEDSLDKRLGYLYPRSSTLSADARSRLGKNAMKLAAPAIAGEFHLVYERFDSGKNAFWVTVFVSFTLRNILQDEAYTDQIEIMVSPDVVPDVVEIGRLLESALSCSNLNPQRIVHVVSKPISVRDKRYQEFVDVTIPAKSEAIHSYSFEVWSLQGVPFEFHAQRYSEGVAVRVSNRTAGQITCELSKGTNNPTVEREILEKKVIPTFSMETLADDVVLDGNKDNMALIVTL